MFVNYSYSAPTIDVITFPDYVFNPLPEDPNQPQTFVIYGTNAQVDLSATGTADS